MESFECLNCDNVWKDQHPHKPLYCPKCKSTLVVTNEEYNETD